MTSETESVTLDHGWQVGWGKLNGIAGLGSWQARHVMLSAINLDGQIFADQSIDGLGGGLQQLANSKVRHLVERLTLASGNALDRAVLLVGAHSVLQLLHDKGVMADRCGCDNDIQRAAPGVQGFDAGGFLVLHGDGLRLRCFEQRASAPASERSRVTGHGSL